MSDAGAEQVQALSAEIKRLVGAADMLNESLVAVLLSEALDVLEVRLGSDQMDETR